MTGLGYFAFPPTGSAADVQLCQEDQPQPPPRSSASLDSSADATKPRRIHPVVDEEERRRQESQRRRRIDAASELALQSEMAHVRMGLSIRDRYGRVDKARTEFVRGEIRRRDELARVIKQWETYETRWHMLLASEGPVAFTDIPWPSPTPPASVLDLHPDAVVQFFVESLQVPGNVATETERLRSALLRWHPDKMSVILSRVVESDLHSVREGINLVFRTLHERIHVVKDNVTSS
ncbi:hypothetical protein C8Q77DRAFT_1107071 [Trametes polyzona]|nr:hypothetical protein C8Q77DRAFT_1107071 [Trametes polyzona]